MTDYRTPIDKPPDMSDEYWEIIEPMVRLNPAERLSPDEV
jgi:hypothetical protein